MSPAAEQLASLQGELMRRAVELTYERMPELAELHGHVGRMRCREDSAFHHRFLLSSVIVDEPEMFADYARWSAKLLERFGIPRSHLVEAFRALAAAVDELAPAASAEAGRILLVAERALAD